MMGALTQQIAEPTAGCPQEKAEETELGLLRMNLSKANKSI